MPNDLHPRVEALEQAIPRMHDDLVGRIDGLSGRVDGLADQITTLTGRMDTNDRHLFLVHEDLVQRINGSKESLRDDIIERIRVSEDETRRQMRVLHEDLVQKITTIGEGR